MLHGPKREHSTDQDPTHRKEEGSHPGLRSHGRGQAASAQRLDGPMRGRGHLESGGVLPRPKDGPCAWAPHGGPLLSTSAEMTGRSSLTDLRCLGIGPWLIDGRHPSGQTEQGDKEHCAYCHEEW